MYVLSNICFASIILRFVQFVFKKDLLPLSKHIYLSAFIYIVDLT